MLNLLDEEMVQAAINSRHLAYCPTMDMIALGTIDEKVNVYRLNGQKIFSVSTKQLNVRVNCVKWKPDGEFWQSQRGF